MSAPYSDIETKAELAVVRHLNGIASLISGVTIHPGVDPSNLNMPCIVANCLGAEEYPKFTGNYKVELQVEIMSQADDTTAAVHRSRVARVRDEFANDWVGASLNTHVTDFTVAGGKSTWGVIMGQSESSLDESHWVTRIPFEIFCRPS